MDLELIKQTVIRDLQLDHSFYQDITVKRLLKLILQTHLILLTEVTLSDSKQQTEIMEDLIRLIHNLSIEVKNLEK